MSRYTVTAERSGKWWVLQAIEAPGAISQVARLEQADVIREAIAFVTGEPEGSIEIRLEPVLPERLRLQLERSRAVRAEAERAAVEAASESRATAAALAAEHYTLRDIGALLDVSYQRAHQLVSPR
jgi:hypothetical protein